MTSGNQRPDSILNYPNDSIQGSVGPDPWWINDEKREFEIGRLVYAILPFVDQNPYALETVGRVKSTQHKEAYVKFIPLDIKSAVRYDRLPIAPLPKFPGEISAVYRCKRRPAMIVHAGGPKIPNELRIDKPRRHTDPCIIVAPFFGEDEKSNRAGYSQPFVERVRRCEYPQFFWDILPEYGVETGSIMRLDQIQPVGRNHSVVEVTNFRLSDSAFMIMNQFLEWFFHDQLVENSFLHDFKVSMSKVPYLCQ